MADVKKIATRVSYGETLVELGAEHDDFVVFDATWPPPPRRASSRPPTPTASLTPALLRAT